MLRCKQVSDALSKVNYWELPLRQRIGLKMHVFCCVVCGPFNRFIMLMQDATRNYLSHEQSDPPPPGMTLTADAKRKISEALKKEMTDE